MEQDWEAAIQRFRRIMEAKPAQQAYLVLLVHARAKWQDTVTVHPWRLDVLIFESRGGGKHEVWVEYRVRDELPIMVFKLGPAGSMNAEPVSAGDICRIETAPTVLDAFLWQIAQPDEAEDGSTAPHVVVRGGERFLGHRVPGSRSTGHARSVRRDLR